MLVFIFATSRWRSGGIKVKSASFTAHCGMGLQKSFQRVVSMGFVRGLGVKLSGTDSIVPSLVVTTC